RIGSRNRAGRSTICPSSDDASCCLGFDDANRGPSSDEARGPVNRAPCRTDNQRDRSRRARMPARGERVDGKKSATISRRHHAAPCGARQGAEMLLRTTRKTEEDAEGGLPIPTQIVSNGEFYPFPQTPRQRTVEELVRRMADERARALGWSRRRFLQSACGTATALAAINLASGCSDAKSSGGFAVDDCATRDPDAARELFQA